MAGCTEGSSIETTDVPISPTVTGIGVEFEALWSPAWSLPEETRSGLRDALGTAGIAIVVPTSRFDEASLSSELRITNRFPTQTPGGELVVRRTDRSVFVSVTTTPIEAEPICAPLLTDDVYPAWVASEIRDGMGCSLDGEVLSMVAWSERGQDFVAEFASELDRSEVMRWLDSWETIG